MAGLFTSPQDEVFGAPQPLPAGASDSQLMEAVSEIVRIFVSRGFALSGSVEPLDPLDGRGFTVKMLGTANLWGRCLHREHSRG